ncbi:hypothetical protein EVAR_2924_1 [Eumeta japonica]|uniref:Uncharacterized protein n=1 Tax=Eumeta variegata TaxID=151549 RepID=A0A4C1T4E0_EUMVA|nr:hypothetical protein EVAR_2924_1 [Eumeta japonica]
MQNEIQTQETKRAIVPPVILWLEDRATVILYLQICKGNRGGYRFCRKATVTHEFAALVKYVINLINPRLLQHELVRPSRFIGTGSVAGRPLVGGHLRPIEKLFDTGGRTTATVAAANLQLREQTFARHSNDFAASVTYLPQMCRLVAEVVNGSNKMPKHEDEEVISLHDFIHWKKISSK